MSSTTTVSFVLSTTKSAGTSRSSRLDAAPRAAAKLPSLAPSQLGLSVSLSRVYSATRSKAKLRLSLRISQSRQPQTKFSPSRASPAPLKIKRTRSLNVPHVVNTAGPKFRPRAPRYRSIPHTSVVETLDFARAHAQTTARGSPERAHNTAGPALRAPGQRRIV